jgi:hypothetical protein
MILLLYIVRVVILDVGLLAAVLQGHSVAGIPAYIVSGFLQHI